MLLLILDNFCKTSGNIFFMTHVPCRNSAQQKTFLTCNYIQRTRHEFLVKIKLCNCRPMHLNSGQLAFPCALRMNRKTRTIQHQAKPKELLYFEHLQEVEDYLTGQYTASFYVQHVHTNPILSFILFIFLYFVC
jgi:hypothetical protein